jgi:putative flippase GtrA
MKARLPQLLRYGTVSIIATTVSMTILGVLVATALVGAGWANVIATAVGTVPSFELNRRWVWGKTGRRSLAAEVGPFAVLSFTGLAISTAAVAVTAQWATSVALSTGPRTLVVELANVAAFGSLWVAQFVVLDRVLFARPRRAVAA